MADIVIANRFTLNGTIDGHDPIGVTFSVKGDKGLFRLTVITVNWGRGYSAAEFKRNVMDVLNKVGEREYVVILIQELDEADSAPEHKIVRADLMKIWEPGTHLVEWQAREPIVVSPNCVVSHERRVITMEQGSVLGAPKGTGPTRFFISCVAEIEGVRFGFGNQHPHRVAPQWSAAAKHIVENARKHGEQVTTNEVERLMKITDVVVHGGDMNDAHYPKAVPSEKVANQRGLDTIRYVIC